MKNTKYKVHKKQSITAVQLRTSMQEKENLTIQFFLQMVSRYISSKFLWRFDPMRSFYVKFPMSWQIDKHTHTRELILIVSNVGPSSVGLVHTWDPIELC